MLFKTKNTTSPDAFSLNRAIQAYLAKILPTNATSILARLLRSSARLTEQKCVSDRCGPARLGAAKAPSVVREIVHARAMFASLPIVGLERHQAESLRHAHITLARSHSHNAYLHSGARMTSSPASVAKKIAGEAAAYWWSNDWCA